MDHAAKVQRKKKLLMAAGINEADAGHVASELQAAVATAVGEPGVSADSEKQGPDPVMANGQGRDHMVLKDEPMYGTGFRHESVSSGSDQTVVEGRLRPGGPRLVGRYSYLGARGVKPQTTAMNNSRTDSPAIATHNEVFSAQNGSDEALGEMVADEPRNRFARTISSGV